MLLKNTTISLIEVTPLKIVQVRATIVITDNGVEVSRSHHRHSIAPGVDYTMEDASVQAICSALHTPANILAYQAAIAIK